MPEDTLTPTPVAIRHGRADLVEDLRHLRAGVLDRTGFLNGWRKFVNPVEMRIATLVDDSERVARGVLVSDPKQFTDPVLGLDGVYRDAAYGMRRRKYTAIRRQHNLQLDVGKNQIQRIQSFGDVGTGNGLTGFSATGTATAPTATTWTGTGTSFPTTASAAGNSGLQGHLVFVANAISTAAFTNPVIGVILSNTATVLTVDQWYAVPVTGAAGTTPSTNSAALVLPNGSNCLWVALSTSTSAAAASDVTRTADGLWGDGTGAGAATEQSTNGLSRAFVGQGGATAPTFPGSKQIALAHTWTYTGASSVTLGKVILFNSLAAAGTIPLLETLLSATGTVTANGDTIQVTWTITC